MQAFMLVGTVTALFFIFQLSLHRMYAILLKSSRMSVLVCSVQSGLQDDEILGRNQIPSLSTLVWHSDHMFPACEVLGTPDNHCYCTYWSAQVT